MGEQYDSIGGIDKINWEEKFMNEGDEKDIINMDNSMKKQDMINR